MDYLDYEELKTLTGIDDIDDEEIDSLALQAIAEINRELNVRIINEEVRYIDNWRKNKISDGETTTFYFKETINNYLADYNNDGLVDEDDVIVTRFLNDDTFSRMTVSSVSLDNGSFTLSETPGTTTTKMLISYDYAYYDMSTPDPIIKLLVSYLTCAYMLFSEEHGLGVGIRFGNISFQSKQGGVESPTTSYEQFYNKYNSLLKRIIVPSNKPKLKEAKYLI